MAEIVDLTQTLKSDIHIYPDDPKFSAKPAFEVPKRDGFRVHALRLGTHTGTHIDAPYHAYKNGKKIDEVPLEWLVGRPVVIDLSSLVGNRDCFRIEWEHLAEYEEEIYKADQGDKILSIRTLQVGTLGFLGHGPRNISYIHISPETSPQNSWSTGLGFSAWTLSTLQNGLGED